MANALPLSAKQMQFAKEYVANGGNSIQAYKKIYRSEDSGNASRMAENAKVKEYIESLRLNACAAASITLAGHLDKLAELRDASVLAGDLKAAISAEVARGKAAGIHKPIRHEVSGPEGAPIEHTHTVDASALTDEQLRAIAAIKA